MASQHPAEQLGDLLANRLRTERVLRDAAVSADPPWPVISREVADSQAAAILRVGLTDLGQRAIPAADLAHCLAAVLASTRQSFYAVNDLSDLMIKEMMPLVTYLSVLAESMVALSGPVVLDRNEPATGSTYGGTTRAATQRRTDISRTARRNGLHSV